MQFSMNLKKMDTKTSIRSIALSAVVVTVSKLYRYFKNKDDLFNLMIKITFLRIEITIIC